MTLDTLLGPIGSPFTKAPPVLDRGDYYYSPPWKGYSYNYDHKGYKSALSALTLLAFLFFLHVLQTCLRDQLLNQSPIVIMMTTTTTTTTTGRKKRYTDDIKFINSYPNQTKQVNTTKTELAPFYDFLVDTSDGAPTDQYNKDYSDILKKLKTELPSVFEGNGEYCGTECVTNTNKKHAQHMYLNEFWLEEETELSCCKHLMCEIQTFLEGRPYALDISRSVGWLCGLQKYYEIGLAGCQEAMILCQQNKGPDNFDKALRTTLSNLIALRPNLEMNDSDDL